MCASSATTPSTAAPATTPSTAGQVMTSSSAGGGRASIVGGAGNDILTGGAGVDTADYSSAIGSVTVNLNLTTAQDTVHAGIDILSGIENLTGSKSNDTLTGDINDNVIVGA